MLNESRWNSLMTRLCEGPPRTESFQRLAAAYSEPYRHYHNLDHIEQCLAEFDAVAALAGCPDELEFAVWLHDVVYDPKASDNEEKSALWATAVLSGLTPPPARDLLACRIRDLIIATAHTQTPTNHDAQLIADIDLAILGQSREVYDEYERRIRAEYAWAPAEAYALGRSRVLRRFLGRQRIYFTERFEVLYGAQARENMRRAVAALLVPR
jgi:predicted metal-dependent HD superfamily phosphohydrolase